MARYCYCLFDSSPVVGISMSLRSPSPVFLPPSTCRGNTDQYEGFEQKSSFSDCESHQDPAMVAFAVLLIECHCGTFFFIAPARLVLSG